MLLMATTVRSLETTRGMSAFMRDDLPFGTGSITPGAGARTGYSVNNHHLVQRIIEMEPIPSNARLEEHGVEFLNLREDLAAAGIEETTFSAELKEHRLAVGKALMAAATRRFAGKYAVHMGDTSKVSGGAIYGEATVRNTTKGSALRAGHYAFHMDSYLPGIAEIHGLNATVQEGSQMFADIWWKIWASDMAAIKIGKQDIVNVLREQSPGLVTIWISLTAGEIQQEPLAVCDKRTFFPGSGELQNTSTQIVSLPGLSNATITVLRERSMKGARWYWRPQMRFGEAFLLSTTSTPHSAVEIQGVEHNPGRTSAEMRMFMVDNDIGSKQGPESLLHL